MIIKIIGCFITVVVLHKLIEIVRHYFHYRKYKRDGVVFMGDGGWSLIRDLKFVMAGLDKKRNAFSMLTVFRDNLPNNSLQLPSVVGVFWFGRVAVYVTSVECLQDLYVNKNAQITKAWVQK